MLAGAPLPSPAALMPVLSMRRCKAPVLGRYGIWTIRPLERRHRVLKSGTGQSRRASSMRLATSPVVCLNGSASSARSGRSGSLHR